VAKLLLISGSLRGGSTNSATLRTAAALAPAGVEAEIYDGMGRLPTSTPTTTRPTGSGWTPRSRRYERRWTVPTRCC
jgi:chromate reductase, NAD(P)H dehydrogenase (quinone)